MMDYEIADNFEINGFWSDLVFGLSDKNAGILFKAIFDYHYGIEEPTLPPQVEPIFNFIKQYIEIYEGDNEE